MSVKNCTSPKDVPTSQHYVILTLSSVTIPGDERSRTNPGHGYPEHSIGYTNYNVYTDKKEWEKEVERLTLSKSQFVALLATPAVVEVETRISIKAAQ